MALFLCDLVLMPLFWPLPKQLAGSAGSRCCYTLQDNIHPILAYYLFFPSFFFFPPPQTFWAANGNLPITTCSCSEMCVQYCQWDAAILSCFPLSILKKQVWHLSYLHAVGCHLQVNSTLLFWYFFLFSTHHITVHSLLLTFPITPWPLGKFVNVHLAPCHHHSLTFLSLKSCI